MNWGIGNLRSGKELPDETFNYILKYERIKQSKEVIFNNA